MEEPKLVNALKCMIRAVEMIIKWLVCSVFSINIYSMHRLNFLFLKYWLLQNRYLDSRLILLSRMRHNNRDRLNCGKGGRGIVNLRAWFPDIRFLEAVLH